jgi:DNA polymerase I
MKQVLKSFLSSTEKKIIFESSKEFFTKTDINPKDFNFEDIEVMNYLLNDTYNQNPLLALKLINENKLSFCYNQVEKKIPFILSQMEKTGILVSLEKLNTLKLNLTKELAEIESKIIDLAGENFNLNSPKQLNEILFNKLDLKSKKKTSGGSLSTNAEVLEDLAEDGVEIAKYLIHYRHLFKLLNTYIIVLIQKSQESLDGRIRTTFSSTSTLTGRLNSKNPNLQNLPAKTEIGVQIKQCFIGAEGMSLVSFDYSQIELRILAHLADVKPLQNAFLNNEDIHKSTASIIFQISPDLITSKQRNDAKAINFGIIYGLSPFALAKTLNISTSEAKEYMNSYFEKYQGIKEYMQATEEEAKNQGFVRTILGKKCYLKDINSSNYSVRSHAIRAAINARIQGSAADLIKKAMVKINDLTDKNCKLILQIHDELVLKYQTI